MDSNEAFPETMPPTVKPAGIHVAMAAFQANAITIGKNTKAYSYKYAPLDHILDLTGAAIRGAGMIYGWSCDGETMTCRATCVADGTYLESSWKLFEDETIKANSRYQRHGQGRTYARRYTFLEVFGLCPTDEDTDAQQDRGGDGGNGDRPAARARTSSSSPVAAAPEGSMGAGLTDPQALAKGFAEVLALSRRVKEAAKAAGDEAACRNDLMAVFVGTDKANPRYVWEGNPTTHFRRGDRKDVTIADVTRLVTEFTKIGKKYGVSS